jgi:hypothetical protein
VIHDHISLPAVTADETRRGRLVADALRTGRRHTRASVEVQLAQPATEVPPLFQATLDARGEDAR